MLQAAQRRSQRAPGFRPMLHILRLLVSRYIHGHCCRRTRLYWRAVTFAPQHPLSAHEPGTHISLNESIRAKRSAVHNAMSARTQDASPAAPPRGKRAPVKRPGSHFRIRSGLRQLSCSSPGRRGLAARLPAHRLKSPSARVPLRPPNRSLVSMRFSPFPHGPLLANEASRAAHYRPC